MNWLNWLLTATSLFGSATIAQTYPNAEVVTWIDSHSHAIPYDITPLDFPTQQAVTQLDIHTAVHASVKYVQRLYAMWNKIDDRIQEARYEFDKLVSCNPADTVGERFTNILQRIRYGYLALNRLNTISVINTLTQRIESAQIESAQIKSNIQSDIQSLLDQLSNEHHFDVNTLIEQANFLAPAIRELNEVSMGHKTTRLYPIVHMYAFLCITDIAESALDGKLEENDVAGIIAEIWMMQQMIQRFVDNPPSITPLAPALSKLVQKPDRDADITCVSDLVKAGLKELFNIETEKDVFLSLQWFVDDLSKIPEITPMDTENADTWLEQQVSPLQTKFWDSVQQIGTIIEEASQVQPPSQIQKPPSANDGDVVSTVFVQPPAQDQYQHDYWPYALLTILIGALCAPATRPPRQHDHFIN